ncbi:MAG: hypothetical protein ACK412_01705 [Chloroherpetonaceae bacterium]
MILTFSQCHWSHFLCGFTALVLALHKGAKDVVELLSGISDMAR